MKIVRLATFRIKDLQESWEQWTINLDGIEVSTTGKPVVQNDRMTFVVMAISDMKYLPKLNKNKKIIVPRKELKDLENAIESCSNLISFSRGEPCNINSPDPIVAFILETSEEMKWVHNTKGVHLPEEMILPLQLKYKLDIEFCITNLKDRIDGSKIFAEFFKCNSEACKYHELMRIFERAFRLSSKRLIDPLFKFLIQNENKYEFTKEEIENWIEIRHGLTHADVKNDFLVERDVTLIINRLELAAYDVYLNKLEWNTPSSIRRNLWRPEYGPLSKPNDIFYKKATGNKLSFNAMDAFGKYPKDMQIKIPKLPDDWWAPKLKGVKGNGIVKLIQ